jgi:tetratricopeptide (TPR) repeat protein
MFSRLPIFCVGVLFAAVASAADPAAPGGAPVQVRVEKVNYVVRPAPAEPSGWKANPALAGKTSYTTDAVILENEYVKAVVLPEFGARLPRVTFKGPGRELFRVSDVLQDGPPWSMGGAEFSFPFCQDGRHLDEGAGWRIVTAADGAVTVAMDMRFSQYAGEVQRYGRFSNLRQAVSVTLRPGTSALEYVSRLDNRLPVRHGFRLWSVASLPREAGALVLLPTGAVTDNSASALRAWPTWDDTDHGVLDSWGTSAFAVGKQGDWAGVYYPRADANHLILSPRYTAAGTRLHVSGNEPGQSDKKVDIWNGSNPLFEHPGNFLQPFGAYVMPLRLAMVTGIGRIDWVGDAVAVSYEVAQATARIRIASFQVLPNCTVMARTKAETVRVLGTIRPNRPLEVQLQKRSEPVLLTVVQGEDADLAEVSLPWRPQPAAPDTLKAVQREMRPWGPLAMELSDWPHDREGNLGDAAKALTDNLVPARADAILHAAAVVLRTDAPGSPRWQTVRGLLDGMASSGAKNPHAEALLGMMLLVETGGRPSSESGRRLAKAEKLPAAAYLLALDAIAAGNPLRANTLLRKAAGAAPLIAMGDGDDALPGGDRLHPAALAGGEWPIMLRAAVALGQNQFGIAKTLLEQLLAFDPARPEALALLAEVYQKSQQTDKAMTARTDSERLFQRNEQARRDYEALLREAREGIWSGIPRP